jgi:ring-1,2-phenylacetyl-CoA epoxidase subunit PaaD
MVTVEEIRAALAAVKDPEIPTCSITDLGIVHDVRVTEHHVEIDLLPTFAGCPALDVIKQDVEQAARDLATGAEIAVRFINAPAWTTDRLQDGARDSLTSYGIAPPVVQIGRVQHVTCPYCGSEQTVEESAFGPTPCRTVRYCNSCRNPFEGFKAKR